MIKKQQFSISTLMLCILLFANTSCNITNPVLPTTNNNPLDPNNPSDPNGNQNTSESQYISFNTPEWNRMINCSLLDFLPNTLNDTTAYVTATSASTSLTFFLTYPSDSAKLIKQSNLKKYPIMPYGYSNDLKGYFVYSQKVPYNDGSASRLYSVAGFSDSTYNEILSIKYVDSKALTARFEIKGQYIIQAYIPNPSSETGLSDKRKMTGTYCMRISVIRKK